MSKTKDITYYVGDFETTVYEGQESTEVWASGLCPLWSEDAVILHSIDDTYDYLEKLNKHIIIYYHNLKFDGSFWISYLLTHGFSEATYSYTDEKDLTFMKEKFMKKRTFTYSISDMGVWYKITIRTGTGHFLYIQDSYKLLPFKLEKIGKSFNTKHKKLEMEYEGYRYAGCPISPEEEEYLKNDLYVIKEALEITFAQGHTRMTIGSCCLQEFKNIFITDNLLLPQDFYSKAYFPDLYQITLPEEFGATDAGHYIHKAYRGGWCYLVKGKENIEYTSGTTADVNSLYPSMMHSESGNTYPRGLPNFWSGNYIPDEAYANFFYIRFTCRFKLKPLMLPTLQIKGNWFYRSTEMLETSDVLDRRTGKYLQYILKDGVYVPTTVTLTMTMMDFAMFLEHYDVDEFEILDGCWFNCRIGMFDAYIDKYKSIKMTSTGAIRELAKLFLNNLYGKMAASTDSSFKIVRLRDDGSLQFKCVQRFDKQAGYIPIGAAITSYARCFTINAAQQNYYGPDKAGFIYADTDSIHCNLPANQIKGIRVHPSDFCAWKLEGTWDYGLFVRPKTYIEHVVAENLELCEPFYNVKCAGMPDNCKAMFIASVTQDYSGIKHLDKLDSEELEFIHQKRELSDFKVGLRVPGKLMAKQIPGGTLLVKTTYEMTDN